DAVDHRRLQRVVMQHRRVEESRKLGLAPHDLFRLAANAKPDRVDGVESAACFRLMLGHGHSCAVSTQVERTSLGFRSIWDRAAAIQCWIVDHSLPLAGEARAQTVPIPMFVS